MSANKLKIKDIVANKTYATIGGGTFKVTEVYGPKEIYGYLDNQDIEVSLSLKWLVREIKML